MGVWDAVKVEEDVWASCCRRRLLLSGVFFFKKSGERKKGNQQGVKRKKKGKNVTYDREVSRDWRARLNEFWFWFFGQFCVSLM